jgi:hypothetical protein
MDTSEPGDRAATPTHAVDPGDDAATPGGSASISGRRRGAYWLAAFLLAIATLYGAVGILGMLMWGDGTVERLFAVLYPFALVAAPAWAIVFARCAARGIRHTGLGPRGWRRMRRVHLVGVLLGIAFTIALFVLDAGEWTLAPVG